MNSYLVGSADAEFSARDFVLITAESTEAALDRYIAAHAPHDSGFAKYICERSYNMSFAELFWLETEEEDETFGQSGITVVDEETFRDRVRQFFGEHLDYADLYLAHFFGEGREVPDPLPFPDEMLIYIWKHHEWAVLEAVDLQSIDRL